VCVCVQIARFSESALESHAQRKDQISLRVLCRLHDGDNAVQDASWRCTDPARDVQLCSTDSRACTHCMALTLHSVSCGTRSLSPWLAAPPPTGIEMGTGLASLARGRGCAPVDRGRMMVTSQSKARVAPATPQRRPFQPKYRQAIFAPLR